jgi:hypothetical protein
MQFATTDISLLFCDCSCGYYLCLSMQQFLKEILNDLCVYNKRGPNQGTHELKPEYKKSTGDADAA